MPSDNALLGCVRKLLAKAEATGVTPAEADPLTADPQLSPVRYRPSAVSAVRPRTGWPAGSSMCPAPGPASATRRLTEVAGPGAGPAVRQAGPRHRRCQGRARPWTGRDLPRHHRCRIRHLP